jgi:hypothetical protein
MSPQQLDHLLSIGLVLNSVGLVLNAVATIFNFLALHRLGRLFRHRGD